ncbi:hypothetical protein BV25DRAFT_1873233 [Artomyces pyxidatus]|uniref:Uncharacterized protein n=1 Tax=Artomyces pyxidatus TaxID=48021 RepID=A0ACB8SGL7_9AGAM|nr:hypothetical protein BV25DRAFT_1873233 [Artomyces pyxidatus]
MNATLLQQGCLGCSPVEVSATISVRTLELYRRLRLRQPRVSVQAWIKTVCDLHNLSYRRSYWRQFTDTFDVYLKILRGVEARVRDALEHTSPDLRVKAACPACHYELINEDTLPVSIIGAMDGGQSLKRIRLRVGLQADPRSFNSSYYITEEDVDRFKYDVKARATKKKKKQEDDGAWSSNVNEATAADGDDEGTTCTDRWKAAMSDSHKRMWAIYRETGIFISACWHGMIWWICDMIESGELAKYPLAITDNRLVPTLRVFGDRIGIGYDIGCSFPATISKSSLADEAKRKSLRMAVCTFHGYAHNRACQLSFHPLYTTGFGIEDIETCKRVFAAFNGLVPITQHASPFHRHQAINNYAQQWDKDKYQESSEST